MHKSEEETRAEEQEEIRAKVLNAERSDICDRREKARVIDAGRAHKLQASKDKLKTVGVALSGGGVRSGAVSLGFLQALYDRGVLNQVDYLSTVSGGGYAGAHLTAGLEKFPPQTTIDWRLGDEAPAGEKIQPLDFGADENRKQSKDVRRLIHSGIYLRKLPELISATLFGVILNWAMLLGGLTAAACAVALLMRTLDHPRGSAICEAIGFSNDVRRAFVIPFVLGVIWLFAQLLHARCHDTKRQLRWANRASRLSLLLVGSLACAIVLVISTADLDTRSAGSGQADEAVVAVTQGIQTWTWTLLVVALLVSLVPFLSKNELLQSGSIQARKTWHPWVARAAGWGMLVGVPLFIFGLVAREDLFGHNEKRPDKHQLSRLHVRDWVTFAKLVEGEASSGAFGPSARVLAAANGPIARLAPESAMNGYRTRLDRIVLAERHRRYVQHQTWFVWRIVCLPAVLLQQGPVWSQWNARKDSDRFADTAVRNINEHVLGNAELYTDFPGQLPSHHPGTKSPESSRKYAAALAEARRLATIVAGKPARSAPGIESAIEAANRELLQVWYWDEIRPVSTVFALNVWRRDQWHRFVVGAGCLALFLVLGLFVDVNLTTAHRYYRDRLSEVWLHKQTNERTTIALPAMKNTDVGGPYHLINATVNLLGPNRDTAEEPTDSFLFSRRYCGSRRVKIESTQIYKKHGISLGDAVAISGAAVSPAAVLNNPVLFYAMLLTNARLGKWVPNPRYAKLPRYPTFVRAVTSYFRGKPEDSAYLYVSDGGHHENTGIEPLLERRARVIIACDASQDPSHQYLDLLRLFRRSTTLGGIRFSTPEGGSVNFDKLLPDKDTGLSKEHSVLIKISYPRLDGESEATSTGWLMYSKSSLICTNPPELLKYQKDNTQFPFDPTLDQFYDPRRFECYRMLGYVLGEDVAARLKSDERNPRTTWLAELDISQIEVGVAEQEGEKRRSADDSLEEIPTETVVVAPRDEILNAAPEEQYQGIAGEARPTSPQEIARLDDKPGLFELLVGRETVLFSSTKRALEDLPNLLAQHRDVTAFKLEPRASYEECNQRRSDLIEEFERCFGRRPRYQQDVP